MEDLIPAAQYLRCSTTSQKYSLQNQTLVIQSYAQQHGFFVIKSFEDRHRSGLLLRNRPGLQSLLEEVLKSTATYRAILVFDVSRWGRFQDCDESAHYEFLCRRAGIQVHYCAEAFPNDGAVASITVKAMKRAMAAEASRESGVRIQSGLRQVARSGFKAAGTVRFGYQRLLVDYMRRPLRILQWGERKGSSEQRVIYTLGPDREVECVRKIFEYGANGLWPNEIASRINEAGYTAYQGRSWDGERIRSILRNPVYAGIVVFGRYSARLRTPKILSDPSLWIVSDRVAPAIVSPELFHQVQRVAPHRTAGDLSERQILCKVSRLLEKEGRLSQKIIAGSSNVPSVSYLSKRFGSLQGLYSAVGFEPSDRRSQSIHNLQETVKVRDAILWTIAGLFQDHVTVIEETRFNGRPLLQVDGQIRLWIRMARCLQSQTQRTVWLASPASNDANLPALLCMFGSPAAESQEFYFMPSKLNRQRTIKRGGGFLATCRRLEDLSEFYQELLKWRDVIGCRSAVAQGYRTTQ